MDFIYLHVLWLLLLIPPLGAAAIWLAWIRREQLRRYYGEKALVDRICRLPSQRLFQLKAALVILSLSAFLVSLSRPYVPRGQTEIPVGTVDVIAIVDVSRSMAAQDYKGKLPGKYGDEGTRLAMARYTIINEVVPSLNLNQLGIVSFSGEAFPQAFITDDLPALSWVLERALTVGSAPGEGSALTKAFYLAFELFDLDSSPDHERLIVLFSDGGNDDGAAALAWVAKQCQKRGIEVIVAGLGNHTPMAIPISQLSEQDRYSYNNYRKEWFEVDGQRALTALDENLLRYFANSVGGRYVRLTQPSDLKLGSLISQVDVKYIPGREEIFLYPLFLAVFCLVLAYIVPWEFKDLSQHEVTGRGARQA